MITDHRFETPADLIRTLTADMDAWLSEGLSARHRASLVVSGGSTPVPLYHALSRLPLAWDRVDITLADERWVGPDHPDSNERMLRRELLQEQAAQARFIGLKTAAATPLEAVPECTERLGAMGRPFDVMVLGMGSDGHTASLFPDAPGAVQDWSLDTGGGTDYVAGNPAHAAHPRLSLSLATLLDARRIVLHIQGDDKWQVYQQALAGNDRRAMPVRAVLQQQEVPVDVYWAP